MAIASWATLLALATPAHASDIDEAAAIAPVQRELLLNGIQEKKPTKAPSRRKTSSARPTRRAAPKPVVRRAAPARKAPVRRAPVRKAAPVRRAAPRYGKPVSRRGRVVGAKPVVYRRVNPWHGVFLYGPAPRYHGYYPGSRPGIQDNHLPFRAVDRTNSLALGLKGGTWFSGANDGALYSDLGLGLMGRYRPTEALGLQLDVGYHAGDTRQQTQGSGSLVLFAFPWTRISPYVLGGATFNNRVEAPNTDDEVRDLLTGLHGGLGVHFGIGQRVGIEFEARYVGYLGRGGQSPVGALQGTGGLALHF